MIVAASTVLFPSSAGGPVGSTLPLLLNAVRLVRACSFPNPKTDTAYVVCTWDTFPVSSPVSARRICNAARKSEEKFGTQPSVGHTMWKA